jgi:hypothetical protein
MLSESAFARRMNRNASSDSKTSRERNETREYA